MNKWEPDRATEYRAPWFRPQSSSDTRGEKGRRIKGLFRCDRLAGSAGQAAIFYVRFFIARQHTNLSAERNTIITLAASCRKLM